MKQVKIVILLMLFGIVWNSKSLAAPTAKVTAKIIDETGLPMWHVDVRVAFQVLRESGKLGLKGVRVDGKSNKKGIFSASNEDAVPQVTVSARKEGYYRSSKIVKFTSESRFPSHWKPWNPTIEIILKKKRKPVAMYAKHTDAIKIPLFDKSIGYDLEKGDLVFPYGKGITSDFIINFFSRDRAYTDYECGFTLSFSNELDGIQEYYFDSNEQSSYRWPFLAPENGYVTKIEKEKSNNLEGGFKSNVKKNVNYLFRLRTKTDENGNIISARYGKILGEFKFGPDGNLGFSYFFNPSGTRNLEFDPEQNLVRWSSRRDEQKHRIKSP